jgi:histidinol-phosphate aminotransferase
VAFSRHAKDSTKPLDPMQDGIWTSRFPTDTLFRSIPGSLIMTARRTFLRSVGLGAAGLVAAPATPRWLRMSEGALALEAERDLPPLGVRDVIRLDRNENPIGPFTSVRQAIDTQWSEANRYPDETETALRGAIAAQHGVSATQVVLGCGSGELLEVITSVFTTPGRGIVVASPTFEAPARTASMLGHPVISVPVTGTLSLDLDRMAAASRGAGLVFLCNPNNPTGTVHGAAAVRDFITRVRRESPGTTILVDEAYHEYVDDPSYGTMMALAAQDPYVIVSRTFSKVYGLAGMRVGYAVSTGETIDQLEQQRLGSGVNQLAAAAAVASLGDNSAMRAEQARNRALRDDMRAFFTSIGCTVGAAEGNFLMVDIKRPVGVVRAACRAKGIAVGRDFPPLMTHLRLSIGTAAQMERAKEVLRATLVS